MNKRRLDISNLLPWIEVRFSRSPGPGGQNVNKVNTRVTLLFDFEPCSLLRREDKTRIRQYLSTRLSRDGRLRVTARRERTQARNRRVALERLIQLLEDTLRVRTPRKPTRPTAASLRRRLDQKRHRGERKRERTRSAMNDGGD